MATKPKKIKKILLTQPNYAWLSKRTWQFPPYTLCLLKACVGRMAETVVYDPNFGNVSEEEAVKFLKTTSPDLVGITSVSTEYIEVTRHTVALVRKHLPNAVIVLGGVIPTVMPEEAVKDGNADYWILGEGELSFPALVEKLQKGVEDLSGINGLAWRRGGELLFNKSEFIPDLDKIPFPDYSNISGLTLRDYGNIRGKYTPWLVARNYPTAVTITSRGCPYRCVFCAGKTVTGDKVRFRSAENVLAEIDSLCAQGTKEIIFLDDHFLADRNRAVKIMKGIIKKHPGLTWKCANVTVWLLDEKLLRLMRKSGCDSLFISIESGVQRILKEVIHKPIHLEKIPPILRLAKSLGFKIVSSFVIGFPGETWDEIRQTFAFSEKLEVDMVTFHIATPLPKTELMDICLRDGLLPKGHLENISKHAGYGKGFITTKDFTPFELEVVRSFEWDRINFSSGEKKKAIAAICGITAEELEDWRVNTRRSLGVNSLVKNILSSPAK
ncbi:MAG: hypothetical protein A2234_06555 [Elusimicrobia bacterium RIFOXYA2_FULL_58_8]|nr:MAG: hypothetical protein A2285_06275 [Elusimicrobia bacterium RIFOXYA12_FULL_57_11]OGS16150.1 MAG: hypothetical protein A2234_06555 [Elusimicrobia bacterium RIFOXYA2_FULL_58_8]